MTRHRANPFTRLVAGTLAALALSVTAVEAVDVRSWDRKIENATHRFVVLRAFDDEAVLDRETQLVWARTPSNVSFASRDAAAGAAGDHEYSCLHVTGALATIRSSTASWNGFLGIYVGGGMFVHAANPGDGVVMEALFSSYWQSVYMGAGRV